MTIKALENTFNSIEYDNFTSEEDYIVKSPREVAKTKKAVCYDLVELQRLLLTAFDYEFKTFFAYAGLPITDNKTHTFVIVEEDDEFFWFESAWKPNAGVHGPFNSYNDAVYFIEGLFKDDGWKDFHVKEYKEFDYEGMNLNEFGEAILRQ